MTSKIARPYEDAINELVTHMWLVDTVKQLDSGIRIDTGTMAMQIISYIYDQPLDSVKRDVDAVLQVSRYSR